MELPCPSQSNALAGQVTPRINDHHPHRTGVANSDQTLSWKVDEIKDEQQSGDCRRSATWSRLPLPQIGRIEVVNSLERASLDNRRKPYAMDMQKSSSVELNRWVSRGCGLNSTYDLFSIRSRGQGPQVIRHGNDGEQHGNQNKVGDPRHRMRVDIVIRRDTAPAS
jgi:hypothetical protein